MTEPQVFAGLGVSLACGFLIGIDRERPPADGSADSESRFGGIRTYPLIALTGALCQLIGRDVGGWFTGLGFAAIVTWIAISYYRQASLGAIGLTSEVAAIIAFACGVLAMQEHMGIAFAVAISTTLVLALKQTLHRFADTLSADDTLNSLKFLVVAFVLLPLLPAETYTYAVPTALIPSFLERDQLVVKLVNPREVGWMVVLIAGIGFTGFLLSKILGARKGLGLSAFLGGLVSSTAVTLSFSGQAREFPSLLRTAVLAILVASTTMFVRVLVEVAAVNPAFLPAAAKVVGPMALAGAAFCSYFYLRRAKAQKEEELELKNPFMLSQAFKFGLLYAGVKFAAGLAANLFGTGGLYVAGFLSGLTDLDAITLSVAQLTAAEDNPLPTAAGIMTIFIAITANSIVKGSLALSLGGKPLGLRVLGAFAASIVVGGAILFLVV